MDWKNSFFALLIGCLSAQVLANEVIRALPIERIIQGGQITTEQSKSWRSVVRIYMSGNYSCTGTFIGRRRILTAAHCLRDGRHLTEVVFFRGGRESHYEYLAKEDQSIKLNHRYYPGSNVEDLAVVYLNKDIMPSGYYPMSIITSNDIEEYSDLIGQTVYMIGASYDKMGTLAFAKGVVESTYDSIDVQGAGGVQGICGGDSGGPLVMDNGRELLLIGVLAGYHMSYNRTPDDNCTEGGRYAPFNAWAWDYFEEVDI